MKQQCRLRTKELLRLQCWWYGTLRIQLRPTSADFKNLMSLHFTTHRVVKVNSDGKCYYHRRFVGITYKKDEPQRVYGAQHMKCFQLWNFSSLFVCSTVPQLASQIVKVIVTDKLPDRYQRLFSSTLTQAYTGLQPQRKLCCHALTNWTQWRIQRLEGGSGGGRPFLASDFFIKSLFPYKTRIAHYVHLL